MPLINGTIISGINAKDATAKSADILQGKTAVVGKELIIGTMPEKAGQTVDGTFDSGTTGYITGKISQDGHYSAGSKLKIPVANLSAGNIKSGVNIGGIVGTYAGSTFNGYVWVKPSSVNDWTYLNIINSSNTLVQYAVKYSDGTWYLGKNSNSPQAPSSQVRNGYLQVYIRHGYISTSGTRSYYIDFESIPSGYKWYQFTSSSGGCSGMLIAG